MGYSLTGCSIHGIFQARILDWVAISFSRGLPDPGIKPESLSSPVGRQILYHWATRYLISRAKFCLLRFYTRKKHPNWILLPTIWIPHTPEEVGLETWSMQVPPSSKSFQSFSWLTAERQLACVLPESTVTSVSDSAFTWEESEQPNQRITQSREHTLYLRSKGSETVLNFYLQIQEFGAIGNIRYYWIIWNTIWKI